MKTEPIVPARIDFNAGRAPFARDFGDRYHPEGGALAQAEHVFLRGNALPARWASERRFTVLETGFGLGNNFLATWAAWRADAQRCTQLVFISVELHPPAREDLVRAHVGSPLHELAHELVAAWPPLTPNIHTLDFDAGGVRLLLALGDAARVLPQLMAGVDAFYLDGFAPARNPAMWDRRLVNALARLARPGATAATWSVAREFREGLAAAGFAVERTAGFDRKREMTVARYAPRFVPRRPASRQAADVAQGERCALVVGAGVAGACAAASLVHSGWSCTVLEQHAGPATQASGNPGGIFHGTQHAVDGRYARFTRAAALLATRRYAPLVTDGRVPGLVAGLLRANPGRSATAMPIEFVRPAGRSTFDPRAAPDGPEPAWLYPGGGWIAPGALVSELLRHPAIAFHANAPVERLAHAGDGWSAFGASGELLGRAPVLVLAGAQGNQTLLRALGQPGWPMRQTRGQITWFESTQPLALPMAGNGYALTLPGGQLLCGATAQEGDTEPALRPADHAHNLERLCALTGIGPAPDVPLHGRVGWRSVAADRLPIVGAVPLAPADVAPGSRMDQARFVPRLPGLYVLGALASRGLTWGPLAGDVLAAWIDGAPMPIEADLLDAIDPARWQVRASRATPR